MVDYRTNSVKLKLQQSKCILDRLVDEWPVGNIGLVSGGQTVHIEIFVIFAIGSGLLTGKVLLKPALPVEKKHTPDFPVNAVRYCLEHSGLSIDELDAVVFYDKPLLKFEKLLETYYAFAPRGLRQFIVSIPVWLKEKMFLKKMLYEGLAEIEKYDQKKLKLLFSEHHLSHAASAFYPLPLKEVAILTVNGVGKWATANNFIKLINAFKEKTGYGIVVNTSFNVRSEPIVCTS